MPAGWLATVPCPSTIIVRKNIPGMRLNDAVHCLSSSTVRTSGVADPAQSPPHPSNRQPVAALAMRVVAPVSGVNEQTLSQSSVPAVLVTRPLPVTLRSTRNGRKVVRHLLLASMTTVV
jgi:hypothetical protein